MQVGALTLGAGEANVEEMRPPSDGPLHGHRVDVHGSRSDGLVAFLVPCRSVFGDRLPGVGRDRSLRAEGLDLRLGERKRDGEVLPDHIRPSPGESSIGGLAAPHVGSGRDDDHDGYHGERHLRVAPKGLQVSGHFLDREVPEARDLDNMVSQWTVDSPSSSSSWWGALRWKTS